MKIVSLVPSITETLFDFGLSDKEIIGRTKFCIHPTKLVKNVEIIGGTKNLNLEKIIDLNPDLIIATKEENEKHQIEELRKHCKVWVTDIKNLADNNDFLTDLGKLLGREDLAAKYIKEINAVFGKINLTKPKKVAYLIWKKPYMTVGSDTFINDVLLKLGFINIFGDRTRYPEILISDLKAADLIFLSSEPYPFQQKHIDEIQVELPEAKINLVDGEAFSWFGTHLTKVSLYLRGLQNLNK